jgi:hypothetical protein
VTSQRLKLFFIILVGGLLGRFIGPAFGEWVTPPSGGLFWQVLPWVLIVVVWIALYRYLKRARPS